MSVADTARRPTNSEFAFTINGELVVVPKQEVSFAEVVAIAYPVPGPDEMTYTVTYRHAKGAIHEGHLVEGQFVEIRKEGTEFDVYSTIRS
ncbi:multiubiquitin domain-containing protein [Subtercola boreus]|nr:multiubiquitin domain-containing protein [Subtercola boreus]